ncbi:MAG: hypothetical protein JW818_04470 [Pirellulales bacterium]|nr:hypothetical protein [Pirellulales bacterium]
MNYKRIHESQMALDDPESGFSFRYPPKRDRLELSYRDWANRKVRLSFYDTHFFSYRISETHEMLPGAEFGEIMDSTIIQSMLADGTAMPTEELHHFFISTNLGQWCEIVAERYEVVRK